MKKIIPFLAFLSTLLTSCQREVSFPPDAPVVHVVEKVVAAIVITNAAQNEFDSIVYRYLPDKTMEVHYSRAGDSVTRTYHYDNAGRLAKLEDEKALYYTNNNIAVAISFQYNSSGQLTKSLTDFQTTSGIPASYNIVASGSGKKMIVYDTAYAGLSYNLGWANRIIYSNLTADNYLLYDSCIYVNNSTGGITTNVSDYSYDGNKNATSVRQSTYQDGQLSEWGVVTVTQDNTAPIYEGLRKKLFRNLTNWYDAGYVLQDDRYRLFTLPGHMYKRMSYTGYTTNGGLVPLNVIRSIEYENEYDGDLLLKSKVTFSVTGQGTIHYVNQVKYYYRLM
jgi:hypothetical protein